MDTILLVVHIIITLALVAIILVQRSSTDGLGGIGGGGSNANLLSGRASANLLTRTTTVLATLFILNSLLLAFLAARDSHTNGSLLDNLSTEQAPTAIEGDVNTESEPKAPTEPAVPIAE